MFSNFQFVEHVRNFFSKLADVIFHNKSFVNDSKTFAFFDKFSGRSTLRKNILLRYIQKELLVYFVVLFLFFFAIFFVNQFLLVIETLLRKHVGFFTSLRLIIYYMPAIIAQSAPFATLVGFLMCLGRMVTDNEILILRASGLRYSKIFIPVVITGLLISIFSFIMNDYFLPIGNLKAQQLTRKIVTSNPMVELEPNSVKRMDGTVIVIGDVDKTNVSDLVLFNKDNEGRTRIISAGNSQVEKSEEEGVLMQMVMDNADVLFLDKSAKDNYDVLTADSMTLNVFDDVIDFGLSGGNTPSTMTSFDLRKRINALIKSGTTNRLTINSYELEFSKKFSIPFASLFFTLLAFPLSLIFGKKDGQILGLVFGLLLSVVYWALTIMGQIIGLGRGVNGYLVTWAPNVLLGSLGIILYLRLRKK